MSVLANPTPLATSVERFTKKALFERDRIQGDDRCLRVFQPNDSGVATLVEPCVPVETKSGRIRDAIRRGLAICRVGLAPTGKRRLLHGAHPTLRGVDPVGRRIGDYERGPIVMS
jgi:hypothetical protein